MINKFLQSEASGGIVLIIAALLALILANNTATAEFYQHFLSFTLTSLPIVGHQPQSVLFWINDGLMAIFFLSVGMEVKAEIVVGALSSRQKALFPCCAALGGMLVPALFFLAFTATNADLRAGWAIPTATDIAFALGILALVGDRIPSALRTFLMALAVIDDLGAIIVIALFYSQHIAWLPLLAAGLLVLVLAALNRCRVMAVWPYLLLGIGLWVCVILSGVHATIAGVLLGLLIPVGRQAQAPSVTLLHGLAPWVRWAILPLFAFANAGIALDALTANSLASWLPLGIMAGLLLGKPIGISAASWLAVGSGVAKLPDGLNFKDIAAVGLLCGIGFTMSVFIASLAYGHQHPLLLTEAKLAILLGSTLSAVVGFWGLKRRFANKQ